MSDKLVLHEKAADISNAHTTVEALRSELENKKRFKTSAFGYDKKSVDEHITALEKAAEDEKQRAETQRKETEAAIQQADVLRHELARAEMQINHYVNQNETQLADMNKLKAEMVKLKTEADRLNEELKQAEDMKQQLREMSEERGILKARVEGLQQSINAANAVNRRLEEEKKELASSLARRDNELEALRTDALESLALSEGLNARAAAVLKEQLEKFKKT
jgi:chromosome segregation ATPase